MAVNLYYQIGGNCQLEIAAGPCIPFALVFTTGNNTGVGVGVGAGTSDGGGVVAAFFWGSGSMQCQRLIGCQNKNLFEI